MTTDFTEDWPERDLPSYEGSVFGRVCETCTFDESVIAFESIPDAKGLTPDHRWVLEFPAEIWDGWVYCSRCLTVTPETGGDRDKVRSTVLREAFAHLEQRKEQGLAGPTLRVVLPEGSAAAT